MKNNFYDESIDEVLKEYNVETENGLLNSEVLKRQLKYGKNILPSKKTDSFMKIFFTGFKEPIVLLLLVTVIVSLFIGEYIDATVIFFIIILDLILGAVSEYQANKNADSLKDLIKYEVKVIRDGEKKVIDSSEIVPGDIILLESGDKITCDMRIIESVNLQVDESSLTGESNPIYKNNEKLKKNTPLVERTNMLYAGCSVTKGRCISVAVKTGINTEIGYIADTVSKIKEEKSPLTIRINKLSKQISLLIIVVGIIVFITLYLKGFTFSEIFMSVVALSVSAMPEGLPLALTMALTITSNFMVKKGVIVKKLYYVEALGSCSVIASDKTGTLTVNEQTAKIILIPNGKNYKISGSGYNSKGEILKLDLENKGLIDKIVLDGKLNNEAKKNSKNRYYGDSIDIAFQYLGDKNNTYIDEYEIIKTIPYESENKYSCVYYRYKDEIYCTVKGSFEVVSSFCKKMEVDNKDIKIDLSKLSIQNDELSKNGYRVIAIAEGKVSKITDKISNLTFLGMVGFIDPVRNDVIPAINKCHEAGIKVLMITGDHPLTAFSIASEIGLASDYKEVSTGLELSKYESDSDFDKYIENKCVFARVTPRDKLRIVESLKRKGEFVAVTGDGVNDALALKSANIGISMGSGTDTAKDTSGMIISDDSFKSIVSAVELGRCAYSNIRKVCFFLLSCGLAEVLFFLLSIIFNMPMPLVAIQLLWLNLVTDGFQDIALSFEKSEPLIMKRKPVNPNESIFNKELLSEVLFSGFYIGIIVFIVWYLLINIVKMNIPLARGYIMALMVFIQNIHVLNCRSERESSFFLSLKSNPLVLFTILSSIILEVIVMEVPTLSTFLKTEPISYNHMFILLIISFTVLIALEIYKLLKRKT